MAVSAAWLFMTHLLRTQAAVFLFVDRYGAGLGADACAGGR
jgi:hypothetical protein